MYAGKSDRHHSVRHRPRDLQRGGDLRSCSRAQGARDPSTPSDDTPMCVSELPTRRRVSVSGHLLPLSLSLSPLSLSPPRRFRFFLSSLRRARAANLAIIARNIVASDICHPQHPADLFSSVFEKSLFSSVYLFYLPMPLSFSIQVAPNRAPFLGPSSIEMERDRWRSDGGPGRWGGG